MAYVAPSTVTTLQTYTSAAHNIIVNDIIDLNSRVTNTGLVYIDSNTFSGSSGVSFNNCFSSTYTNYRIICTNVYTASGDASLYLRLRVGGVDNSTVSSYSRNGFTAGVGSLGYSSETSDKILFDAINADTNLRGFSTIEAYAPYVAKNTHFKMDSVTRDSVYWSWTASHNQNVAYDGFTIYPSASTISGTITVYGYKG